MTTIIFLTYLAGYIAAYFIGKRCINAQPWMLSDRIFMLFYSSLSWMAVIIILIAEITVFSIKDKPVKW